MQEYSPVAFGGAPSTLEIIHYTSNMKAIVIHQFCETFSQIQVSELEAPQAQSENIVVKVMAAGVNFVDTLYARGKHQNNRSLVCPPFTLGIEFSGIVVSAPRDCLFKCGDAVFGDQLGSFAEFLTLPVNSASLQKMPSGWSFADSACLPATLPVSYGALVLRGKLVAGETVLIHAAAGGLGIMAVQIAVAMGCTVLGTASSTDKCRYAESYGAMECFNYSQDDWQQRVLESTNGKGVHVVFDPVGLVSSSLKCIEPRGRVLIVGFAGREGQLEQVAMNRLLLKQATLIGYRYGESLRRHPEERYRIWSQLQPLIDSGKIKPAVSVRYQGLENVAQALADITERKVAGKAAIMILHGDKPIGRSAETKL